MPAPIPAAAVSRQATPAPVAASPAVALIPAVDLRGAAAGMPRYLPRTAAGGDAGNRAPGTSDGSYLASSRAESDADRVADRVSHPDNYAGEPRRDAGDAPPVGTAARVAPPPPQRLGGASLGPLARPVGIVTGVDLGGVRVHRAPHLARAVGARAFARGGEIFVGNDADNQVLAHEAAHVAQQARGGRAGVQRWADPTASTLTAEEVAGWSDAELIEGLRLLLDQLAPVDRSVPVPDASAADENLRLILITAVPLRVNLPDDLLARLPERYGPHTDAVVSMHSRLDLIAAKLNAAFPDRAPALALRLDHFRKLYPWLDAIALEHADHSIAASLAAVETAVRIHRATREPGEDVEVQAAITTLDTAIANLLDALLTPDLPSLVAEVETARDAWLEQLVGSFSRTIAEVRSKIATPIDPRGFGKFSSGTPYSQPMHDVIAALENIRVYAVGELDQLAARVPGPSVPMAERLDFIARQSAPLDARLAVAEKVLLGLALCEQGQALADATWDTYQINDPNFRGLQSIFNALFELVRKHYSREEMPGLRTSVEAALKHSDERLESIRTYESRVNWFINIAATLLGIGAMRAVMALPAVAGLGRTGATIVGSLAFTGTRLVLTGNQGRPWSVGGVLEDAAKDYFLLRLLGGVDARIVARVGGAGTMAAAARIGGVYGTLVAWTLTWNVLQPGAHGPTGAPGTSTGEIMVQTGVDLAALLIAEALLRAPAMPTADTGLVPAGRNRALEQQARRAWEALRRELEATGRQLREWTRGNRADATVGDALLARAGRLFTRTKELHGRFAEAGEITDPYRAQLDANADAMLESIRNARDEVRLDVRNVTAESWSYRGSAENVAAYLERLKTQGRADEVTAEGNGIFSVRHPDGTLHWFFPAGRETPAMLDLVAESVEAAAPGLPEATRGQALVHLRGAGWSDLGTFAGGLPPGRGEPFIEWVARPDAGAALARNQVPMPVVRALALRTPEQFDPIARGSADTLPIWHAAWKGQRPNGTATEFVTDISDLLAWRGTLDVASPFEATAILARRAGATAPTNLRFTPRPPGWYAKDPTAPVYSEFVGRALQSEIVPGARYSEITRFDVQFVVEIAGGRVTRMFEITADGRVVRRVPVGSHLTALREVLFNVEAARDPVAARAELARADPLLHELDVLRDFRTGIPVDHIHLLETLAGHPMRRATTLLPGPATTQPATLDPAAPAGARPRRRIVVSSRDPAARDPSVPQVTLDRPDPLARRPRETESAFVDRVVSAQERAYWEAVNGPAGRGRENPGRWARVQSTFTRLVAAMRTMQARLQRAGNGAWLPEINDGVLNQPVDIFVMRNPALRQLRIEIEARLRENAAQSGRSLSESPEWNALQDLLGRGRGRAGARETMGERKTDIVEFMLEEGNIHISDVTTQTLDPLSVHAFKTRIYVEIMRSIVGSRGPRVSGQDIEMHVDTSGKRIDPAKTRFGEIIE